MKIDIPLRLIFVILRLSHIIKTYKDKKFLNTWLFVFKDHFFILPLVYTITHKYKNYMFLATSYASHIAYITFFTFLLSPILYISLSVSLISS